MMRQSGFESSTYEKNAFKMKFLICAFALVAAAFAAPPPEAYSGYTKEGLARIVAQDADAREDGSYRWSYETENGIAAVETNQPKPAGPNGEPAPDVQGSYRYVSPDGSQIEARYTAGEQGFIVEGAHIPTSPPIPEEILRGLEWNAAHPEEEAQWDPENYKPGQKPIYTGRK